MRLSSSLAFLAVFPIVNLALKVKLPRDHNPKLGPRDSHLRIKRRGCQIASSASSIPATSTSSTLVLPSDKSVGGLQIPSNSTGVLNQTPAIDSSVVAISGGSFNYGKDKIKGVNLGGWLVIESFLTPSLFAQTGNNAIIDEWTFCQLQEKTTAEAALQHHWDTFITEDDFAQIAAAGLNHVRIPVGYWSWDTQGDEPYIKGAEAYLDKAVGWAGNHGIKVLIDLHGVPASQNGFDNSGRKGEVQWHTNPDNVKRSVDVIRNLAGKYGAKPYSDTVTMIQLLNEPTLWLGDGIQSVTKQYYLDAYEAARRPWGTDKGETSLIIVFHDGFQRMDWWNGYMNGFKDVWIDDHYYQAFVNKYFDITAEEHLRYVCRERNNFESSPFPSIAGEWSISLWSCKPAERNSPMGFIGTCDLSENNAQADFATFLRVFFEVQTQMFENDGKGQGWFFFNWKTENLEEWSYQAGLRNRWISSDLSDTRYDIETICAGIH